MGKAAELYWHSDFDRAFMDFRESNNTNLEAKRLMEEYMRDEREGNRRWRKIFN
jgi:hypothetical protein